MAVILYLPTMWYNRDLYSNLGSIAALPIKVLKGPRQSGKTSLLDQLGSHRVIFLDDALTRSQAQENPRFFLDTHGPNLILDEASLAPALFPELKRRVDEARRNNSVASVDYWITGSNQTLLRSSVAESLAGRASYFDLNTLSIHELGADWRLPEFLFKGGWPELYASPHLSATRYLNDLIATFIERDIVAAAGIEKHAAFLKVLQLAAGRTAQLLNVADIAVTVGVDATTVSAWLSILETNGIVRLIRPYWTNLNKRLTKTPKIYLEDVGLATRLQGWTELAPLLASPVMGHLVETVAVSEVVRFFQNHGSTPQLSFLRSRDKVEIDLIIHLPNNRAIAAEIKSTPSDLTVAQEALLSSTDLNIIERWVLSPTPGYDFPRARLVALTQIWEALRGVM